MSFKCVVLVKQVPDTANITGRAMKDDGTVNRAALPAIFNPEDLNALEMALQVKDEHGAEVTVLTMGPARAAEVLREALYRGADRVILLSDRKFAGADTLATSYALERAVSHAGDFDLVFCGRQAIDGDTAQVGPQVAEKMGLPQITYADAIVSIKKKEITVRRAFPRGTETVKCALPCLLTVVGSANRPRPASSRRAIANKLAATPLEYKDLLEKWPEFESEEALDTYLEEHGLKIPVWSAADVGAEEGRVGLAGSPTRVLKVDYVVLGASDSKEVDASPEGAAQLFQELAQDYIL
ncbi:MAG: electron transfer flavoprotein beta subunit/FixA family protein [Anaerolineales bacterium]|nr:MAG: electron transfer flavoprotein beta subunit/FixA family protein [Anaerolineales bacterium]